MSKQCVVGAVKSAGLKSSSTCFLLSCSVRSAVAGTQTRREVEKNLHCACFPSPTPFDAHIMCERKVGAQYGVEAANDGVSAAEQPAVGEKYEEGKS